MKATYKRYLAAAFATVGLLNLGISQTTQDPVSPDKPSIVAPAVDNSTKTDLGFSANGTPITLDTSNAPRIMINQTEVNFDSAQPGMINDQLMIPVRDVAEQCGAKVDWVNQDKQVVLNLPSQQAVALSTNSDWLLMIGNDQQNISGPAVHVMLDGNEVILVNNRAYMPFDELAVALNGSGSWDQTSGTATIVTTQGNADQTDQVPDSSGTPPSTPTTGGTDSMPGTESGPS